MAPDAPCLAYPPISLYRLATDVFALARLSRVGEFMGFFDSPLAPAAPVHVPNVVPPFARPPISPNRDERA